MDISGLVNILAVAVGYYLLEHRVQRLYRQ